MPSPPTKRRHHVVPAFVLAQFATPPTGKGRLYALDKDSGNVIVTSAGNATIEKDYYVLPDDSDLDEYAKDVPEDDLARIEHAAAPVIQGLSTNELPDTFDDRAVVALFTAMMRARTPREREQFAAASEQALNAAAKALGGDRQTVDQFLRDRGDDASPEAVEQFARRIEAAWQNNEIELTVPLDRSLGTLMRLAVEMSATIDELPWWLLAAPPGCAFVTSDCPVAMFDVALREGRGNAFQSSPLAQTTLPLSQERCLLMLTSGPETAHRDATIEEVDDINLRTYAWARRWVFGPSEQAVRQPHARAEAHPDAVARVAPRPYFSG